MTLRPGHVSWSKKEAEVDDDLLDPLPGKRSDLLFEEGLVHRFPSSHRLRCFRDGFWLIENVE